MAKIEHVRTGRVLTNDQGIPPMISYSIEFYDEEMDELVMEDRIEIEGEEYRVLDDDESDPQRCQQKGMINRVGWIPWTFVK